MKILGLDYGEKRIGIAISDELGIFAHPLTTVDARELDKITDIIKKNSIEVVVIGKPLNLNGTSSKKTQEVQDFIAQLRKTIKIPVYAWDERFSTKEAERILLDSDVSRKKRKRVLDKISARIILQGYLDSIRKKDV